MTIVAPPLVAADRAVLPESVQPGGGSILAIEMAWGRFRRAFLRSWWPGYVKRMAERRRGPCPGCPHDVIDARDLKWCRNVCGYSFADADDPFRWRGQLGLVREGLAEVLAVCLGFSVALLPSVAVAVWVHPAWWVLVVGVTLLWFQLVYFFRDPDRLTPTDPTALVSPADGTVTDVGAIDDPDFPGGRVFRISIFLSIFDVHVNRVPRGSRVTQVRYLPGAFLDARDKDASVRNEQLWVDLEEPNGRPLRVKQISGAIARRIVCRLKPGETVAAGDRYGMIKFGSRTEVSFPAAEAIDVQVKVGDSVRGGSTVLVRFKS